MNFVKSEFHGSEYVTYNSKFVARFKYSKSGKGSFLTFLTKNFTVDEYFARLATGEAPLTILSSAGYLQPHVKKMLKEQGYPVTVAGFAQLVQVQTAPVQDTANTLDAAQSSYVRRQL